MRGERIVAVGAKPSGPGFRDLGNVAILPGLVNAHCHLEFSDLDRPLGEPGIHFVDWARALIARRGQAPFDTSDSVRRGLQESRRMGTTTLGDIAQPGYPDHLYQETPLHSTVFLELIAPTVDRVDSALRPVQAHLDRHRASASVRSGLSPHAPYSVHPDLLLRTVELSAARLAPIAMHLAETREELEFLRSAAGPFREFLQALGAWDDAAPPANRRPLDYLQTLSNAHRSLVIHGNFLDGEEIALAAKHADRMSVVYCPRSHAHFRHDRYPLARMSAAGAMVSLGTDSQASAPDLSVLAEARHVARTHQDLAPAQILSLATRNGARALGRDRETGSLEVGKLADLAIVALPDHDTADPHELLLNSDLPVVGRYYRGREWLERSHES
jgi:cytosine/adenosine deaminase-related metal-dependent hydrolase